MENTRFTQLAPPETVLRVIGALKQNGIDASVVQTGAEAKQKILALVPAGAEVMAMSSETLRAIGVTQEVDESGRYDSVRTRLTRMNPAQNAREMRCLGAAPDWALGSVHAVTENGELLVASNTGSQLPAYAFGAGNVVWVVGTQKIVKDRDEGFRRIYEHSLVLESERARKAYGVSASAVNKVLVINRENQRGRATLIFVNEALGF